jgi:putative hydrolase of the HAD superfamily
MKKIMNQWIIFDAMGVIYPVRDDTNALLVPFIQKKNPLINREFINQIYRKACLGEFKSITLWEKLGFNDYSIEKEYLDECQTIDPDFIKTALELKEKYKIAMISNDIDEWSKYLRKKYGLDKIFDTVIISGEVKLRKPDPEIFILFLEEAGTTADACIFIDDRPDNLKAASLLGIKTILFNRDNDEEWKIEIKSFTELNGTINLIINSKH